MDKHKIGCSSWMICFEFEKGEIEVNPIMPSDDSYMEMKSKPVISAKPCFSK